MLEGTWHLISGEQDGQPVSETDIQNSKLEISGDSHEVTVGDGFLKGTHTLGSDQSRMTIDATDTEGPYVGSTLLGIFKVEDGVFTVCFAAAGKERPTEFTTKDGKATILHSWQRSI